MLANARLLVAALWAGSLWALGYIAAPAVFARAPDSTVAGTIVGALLERQAWVAMACAVILLVLARFSTDLDAKRRRWVMGLVVAMLACALVIYLGLQPAMAQMRDGAGPAGVRASADWPRFAAMHGVSQVLHLVQSVLAAVLLVKVK